VAFSQGYHPKPRVAFGPALPVGVESGCEHLDLELVGIHDAAVVVERLRGQMPAGLPVYEGRAIDPRAPSISESLRAVHYVAEFPEDWDADRLERHVGAFREAEQAVVRRAAPPRAKGRGRSERIAPGKPREINLKEIVTHMAVEADGRVAFSLRADPSGSAKPAEVLAAIFGGGAPPRGVKVLKEGVSFARTPAARIGPPRAPRYHDA
jgi:radical SAM-linked protein